MHCPPIPPAAKGVPKRYPDTLCLVYLLSISKIPAVHAMCLLVAGYSPGIPGSRQYISSKHPVCCVVNALPPTYWVPSVLPSRKTLWRNTGRALSGTLGPGFPHILGGFKPAFWNKFSNKKTITPKKLPAYWKNPN